jgi:hypothetical protein
LEGTQGRPPVPEAGVSLRRGSEVVIAGLRCVDWSWTDDVVTHTVCATEDGVLLRHVADGQTIRQAHSVTYAQQRPDLFQVPPDYAPALAPEGGTGD